ncbi:type II secretion system protein GspL [Brenneria alni]|uniref:Type II secretion system protein GspL n=1 Tax=Brenneria alni TaxID=71656 RepID=A0A421DKC6_9GAMM|nr:type II secretion system protein GspL [Brenneria alni]
MRRRWKARVLTHRLFKKQAGKWGGTALCAEESVSLETQAQHADTLIIRLPVEEQGDIEWLAWSLTGESALAQGRGDIAQVRNALAAFSSVGAVRVLVPATEVTLHKVSLPRLANRQLAQALPFMLEDQLAAEVEQLHFAVLEKQGNEATVAVVEKSRMQHWQMQCRGLEIVADTLLPDAWVLPRHQDGWSALNHQGVWLFRQENGLTMAAESSWCADLLSAVAPTPGGYCYSIPTPAGEWQPQPETDLFRLAAKMPLLRAPADLRQGEFAPATPWRVTLLAWRGVSVAALCYVLLLMGQAGWSHYQLYQQAAWWRQQSVRVYQQIFPTETQVVNPRSQMQRHLLQASAVKDGPGLMRQLNPLQQLITKNGDIQIRSLSYDRAEAALRLSLQATSYPSLEQFQRQAAAYYQVQAGDMRQENQYVEGWLTLRSQP